MGSIILKAYGRQLKRNHLYRHFKGHIVTVLDVVRHTETELIFVLYVRNETGDLWVRPLKMFMSEVDHKKYPDVKQKYRFEEISESDICSKDAEKSRFMIRR